MSENKNFITSKYQIEEMTGKDNTLIIRRKDGIIIAFIEVKDNTLVSFRRHENRKVSINFLNKFASYVKKQGYKLNIGVSKEIGMSIVRDATGRQTYITSDELKKYGLEKYVQTGEAYQININNLMRQDLKIPDNSSGNIYDFHNSHVKRLKIGKNVFAEIDLRENQYIEKVEIAPSFAGKINLSSSQVKSLHIGAESKAEISAQGLNKSAKLTIGDNFIGTLNIRDSAFSEITLGAACKGHINLMQCLVQHPIIVGNQGESLIRLHNVYAKYILLNQNFHGDLKISGDKPQLGIRRIFAKSGFVGHMDLSNNNVVERIELGKNAEGSVELIGTSSIKIVRLGENFSGKLDGRESGLVYLSAGSPCSGEFILNDTTRLAEMKLPKSATYRVYGATKPTKIIKQKQYVIYKFKNITLPKSYYQSRFPYSIWQKLAAPFTQE